MYLKVAKIINFKCSHHNKEIVITAGLLYLKVLYLWIQSTEHILKIFEEKNPESSKNQNLSLPHTEHYAESTQMK